MASSLWGGIDGALSLSDNNASTIYTLPAADFGDSTAVVVRHIDDAGLDPTTFHFVLAPNPAQAELYLNWFNPTQVRIQVYDICGKLLLTKEEDSSNAQLDIQALSAGTYLLQLSNSSGAVVQQKFVKQ
jgi:hypothetical protein